MPEPDESQRRDVVRLSLLFGLYYFVQGISEPTAGLISQPVRSLLKTWKFDAAQIGQFWFWVGLPWTLKPLYGILTDFVPLFGSRRKSYLLLTSFMAAAMLLAVGLMPLDASWATVMGALLVPATLGVAFSDVVIDALMVERGQPLGLTGRLQAVQWTCIWAATILTGWLGGVLSERESQRLGFWICSEACFVAFLLTFIGAREPARKRERGGLRRAARELWQTLRSPAVLAVGGFFLLWQFNPFSASVQYLYMTQSLGFSEEFYGKLLSIGAGGSMLGSLLFGFYSHRLSRHRLVHVSIAMGVLMTTCYWGVHDEPTAVLVSFGNGFAYSTAVLAQLDVAARCTPLATAGTTFALLAALSNLGQNLSELVGGALYGAWQGPWGASTAFHVLVGVGAASTACCWLLVPLMRRAMARATP